MRTTLLSALALAGALLLPGPSVADPWKDESGHGHRGGPPPWAPAHGERHKRPKGHQHRERRESAAEVSISRDSVIIRNGRCDLEAAGAVIGGILGGVVGNRVGRHNGNAEFGTVAGAIIGVVVGKSIGRDIDKRDASCAAHALEKAPNGQSIAWRNPDSGLDFRLTPTESFRRDGNLCRRYRTETIRGNERVKARSEACRTADGKWHFGELPRI